MNIKKILGVVLIIAAIAGALYVGIYLMTIKPIIDIAHAIDDKTITMAFLAKKVLLIIFADSATGVIAGVLGIVGHGVYLAGEDEAYAKELQKRDAEAKRRREETAKWLHGEN